MRKLLTAILAMPALFAHADAIDDIMAKMTLREKIGQCVQIELAKIPLSNATETAAWFAKYPIGSVFMGKDLAALTEGAIGNAESLSRCAAATKIPLSVAGDLGPVTAPCALPGNGAIGAVGDLAAAREYGRLVGRIGRSHPMSHGPSTCLSGTPRLHV